PHSRQYPLRSAAPPYEGGVPGGGHRRPKQWRRQTSPHSRQYPLRSAGPPYEGGVPGGGHRRPKRRRPHTTPHSRQYSLRSAAPPYEGGVRGGGYRRSNERQSTSSRLLSPRGACLISPKVCFVRPITRPRDLMPKRVRGHAAPG